MVISSVNTVSFSKGCVKFRTFPFPGRSGISSHIAFIPIYIHSPRDRGIPAWQSNWFSCLLSAIYRQTGLHISRTLLVFCAGVRMRIGRRRPRVQATPHVPPTPAHLSPLQNNELRRMHVAFGWTPRELYYIQNYRQLNLKLHRFVSTIIDNTVKNATQSVTKLCKYLHKTLRKKNKRKIVVIIMFVVFVRVC